MRLVLDTNVLVSAFLWKGTPGRLVELATEKEITLHTSRALVDELSEVLHRKKFAKQVAATGYAAAQIVRNFRRLAHAVSARILTQQASRDPDDDALLACAAAARADLIVSGDDDVLALKQYRGIPIVTPAQALRRIAG